MEKVSKCYLGMDVSKLYFDVSLMHVVDHQSGTVEYNRFDNTAEGMKTFKKYLQHHKVPFNSNTLAVIENTGVYHRLIWGFCTVHNVPLYIGNALHIKNSFGLVRGKNDKIDSQRLCRYAYKHEDEIKITQALNPGLLKLKDLMTARTNLVKHQSATKSYIKELGQFQDKSIQKLMEKSHRAALKGLATSIEQLEKDIEKALKEDSSMYTNYTLLKTVPGVGHITAVYMLCWTGNFSGGISGKQLACYAGVVPFSERSGSSIRGKNKVHKMANKDLKKLLHLCALSAIRCYPEFQDYYQRKVSEGKHPMGVLNAIRNKIALRAAAVIREQKEYVNNYKKAA